MDKSIDNPNSKLNKQDKVTEHPLQPQLDAMQETMTSLSGSMQDLASMMKTLGENFSAWKAECDLRAKAGRFGGGPNG
jgi:hypothetical protein